jgi:glycine cleavage system transcriptional repressor
MTAMTQPNPQDSLVITASGEDRVGLVDGFTGRIVEAGCNIEESRMALLGGQFALIMLLSGRWDALARLEAQLDEIGEQLGLAIIHKRTREREAGRDLIPYQVDAISVDHPGIVQGLSSFFAQRGINIEQLDTDTYPAPHSGTPMFSVRMTVGIPADTHIPTLRGDFLDHCDSLNLDASFEPARG